MKLADTERYRNAYGKRDPLWAIMTLPGKDDNLWDEAEFFETGLTDVACVREWVERAGWAWPKGRGLDFGCGVGRLSQALARQRDEVHGVDIAASMIARAEGYNRYPGRCVYHHNNRPALSLFGADHSRCASMASWHYIVTKDA